MEDQYLDIPQDTEAEQAVLGSIIFNNEILNDIAGILEPKSFYFKPHQHVYRAMIELAKANQPIDEILIGDQLKTFGKLEEIGGYQYLAELVECCPSEGNIVYYAKIIEEKFLLREILIISNTINQKSRDPKQNISELLKEAETKIVAIATKSNNKGYRHIRDIFQDNFQRLEDISKNTGELSGIETGFIDLDKMTCGLQPSDLIIVAARPSMGKTAFALNIASHVAKTQAKNGAVLVFSLEMGDTQLSNRLLSSDAKIDSKKFRSGKLDQEEWDKLSMSTDRLSNMPLYINDSSKITPHEMSILTKKLDKELDIGVSLVVVDYVQLAQGKGNPAHREQEIANITRTLKGLAKDMDIPVIALSQLNRALESRSDKRPLLSDLRESGAIEQDADVVIFLYRDDFYNKDSDRRGIAEIIFRKHRNGPLGTVDLGFTGKYTKFFNLGRP